jgi:hypothetical protein
VIVHEARTLKSAKWGRDFGMTFAGTNELRTKGTDALPAAAREAGVRRFVAQLDHAAYHHRCRRATDGSRFTEPVYLDRASLPTDRLVSADNHGASSTASRPDGAATLT